MTNEKGVNYMEQIYSVASPSSSTLYGNIGSAIKELIISKFPYEFFKYVNVSSELAFRNFRRNLKYNSANEMSKRLKPFLIIKPIYSVGGNDLFLNDIPLTKNFDNIEYGIDKRYLFPVIKDVDNHYQIDFKMNRDKIDFDITLTVATLHQQLDVYKAMLNQFVWDRPYAYKTALESVIPRSIVKYVSTLLGYDIDKDPSRTPTLLRYLKKNSKYPITYKIRNASSLDEFFMYYNHDVIVTFSDLTLDDAVKKNMTDESYNITFRVSAEFNLPGLFLLSGNNETLFDMKIDMVSSDDNSKEFIPLCTYTNFYNKYPSTLNGFKLYTSSIFNVESNPKTKEDYLDIEELFEPSVLQVIKENIALSNSIESVLNLILIKNNEELTAGTDWEFNPNKLRVIIKNPEKESTYRIVVYFNSLKINDRLVEIFEETEANKTKVDSPIKIIKATTPTGVSLPTQSKVIIPSTSQQNISADDGYVLTNVIIGKIPSSGGEEAEALSNEEIQRLLSSI